MSFAIEARGLVKDYGEVRALDGVNLLLEEGQSMALLGPNGAGKTTFIKSLLGLIRTTEGELRIFGKNAPSEESRRELAYLPEKFSFYPYYTVEGVVNFFAELYGSSRAEVGPALERVGMSSLAKRKMKTLSKGQMQRVGVANMLVSRARLLLLDEPFSGLDPIGIKELKDLFVELHAEGKTLFFNSHILSEMERVTQHIAIVNHGKLLVQGEIKSLLAGRNLEDYFYDLVGKKGEV